MVSRTSLLLVVGLVGCGTSELDSSEPVARKACTDPTFCGTNSPAIQVYRSYHFNLASKPNEEGLELLGLVKNNVSYRMNVTNGRIWGRGSRGEIIAGHDLRDARIYLESKTKDQFAIIIRDVGSFDEVVRPNNPLETYVLEWAEVLGNRLPEVLPGSVEQPLEGKPSYLCPDVVDPYANGRSEWDESVWMAPYESLVFEGDLIRANGLTVDPTPDSTWFNIGCGAHTLAKLRLTRNTINTTTGDWRNVQAALKMLSADYGGDGTPWTQPGVPLVWRDQGAMTYLNSPKTLEGRWNENGAMCLGDLRHADIKEVMAAYPHLERCADIGIDTDPQAWIPGELITSANY